MASNADPADWIGAAGSAEGTQGAEDKAVPPASARADDSQVDSQAHTQRATSRDFAGMEPRNFGLNGRCWTVTEPLPRICKQGVRGSIPLSSTEISREFGPQRADQPSRGAKWGANCGLLAPSVPGSTSERNLESAPPTAWRTVADAAFRDAVPGCVRPVEASAVMS